MRKLLRMLTAVVFVIAVSVSVSSCDEVNPENPESFGGEDYLVIV